jgi:DNA-binding response OmpR family regulator
LTPPESRLALAGARILVVEDDFIISMELGSILADAGAKVIGPCHTPAQAVALIDANKISCSKISCAILDFRLGRETSLPVARQLIHQGVPFAFFTGQVNTTHIRAEFPDARIITKPFQDRAILRTLAEICAGC